MLTSATLAVPDRDSGKGIMWLGFGKVLEEALATGTGEWPVENCTRLCRDD